MDELIGYSSFEENNPIYTPEQLIYLSKLDEVLNTVTQCCNNSYSGWYLIGGLPLDAYEQNKGFVTFNKEKGVRDVDILARIDRISDVQRAKYANATDIQIDTTYHTILNIYDSKAFLKLGNTKTPLDLKIFDTRYVDLGGVVIPTLHPQTLLHLYAVGIAIFGGLRQKDFINALRLARFTRNYDSDVTNEDCEPFHEFLTKSNYKNNLYLNALRLYRKVGLQKYIHPDNTAIQPLMEFFWKLTNR